jgi:membrane-associated phospholipid phosphatase
MVQKKMTDYPISRFFRQYPFVLQLLIIVGLLLVLFALGIIPSTERIILAFVFVMLWSKQSRSFLIDFAPFLILVFTYDSLRNIADNITSAQPHVQQLINWERALTGGTLPSYYLQQHLWGHFYTPVLDVLTNTLYLSHFLSPLILAVVLWYSQSPRLYWVYAAGLVVLSYAAFATYILYPAAPPWWATSHGYLNDTPVTLKHFIVSADVVSAGPNPVAAMPSLHAAYPTYIALVSISTWKKKGLPVLLLPLGVAFATIYQGHHYVVDALAGAIYATITFSTVFLGLKRYTGSFNLFSRLRAPRPDRSNI